MIFSYSYQWVVPEDGKLVEGKSPQENKNLQRMVMDFSCLQWAGNPWGSHANSNMDINLNVFFFASDRNPCIYSIRWVFWMQLGWKESVVPSLSEWMCSLSPLVSWRITKGSETRTLIALYPALNKGQHWLFQQKLQEHGIIYQKDSCCLTGEKVMWTSKMSSPL